VFTPDPDGKSIAFERHDRSLKALSDAAILAA
jgi:hypothetical protein